MTEEEKEKKMLEDHAAYIRKKAERIKNETEKKKR